MAEENSNSGLPNIPWTTIAMLLATAGSALFLLPPLTSSRPGVAPAKSVESLGRRDVDSRLWQDPFKASYDHRDAMERRLAEMGALRSAVAGGGNGRDATQPTAAQSFEEDLQHELDRERQIHDSPEIDNEIQMRGCGHVLVLPVMVNAAPTPNMPKPGCARARRFSKPWPSRTSSPRMVSTSAT